MDPFPSFDLPILVLDESIAISKQQAFKLVDKLLIYFKYYHEPNINYLHLIDVQPKREPFDLLQASQRNLGNLICDIFNTCSQVVRFQGLQTSPFSPIKIHNSDCVRCQNTFTVSINQFKFAAPGYNQYRRDVTGKRFTDHSSIKHLHLIDYSKKSYKFVPNSLVKKYEATVCKVVLPFFDAQIENFHARQLPYILPKLVSVIKLLNLECISAACVNLHMRIVDLIREKHFDEPLLLLDVWKSLLMSDQLIVGAFEKLTDHFPTCSKEKLRWVLVMASYLKFDLNGAWMRGIKLRNFSNCPATSSMLVGDYAQMKTLFDFGFLPNSKPLARYNIYIRHLNRTNLNNYDLFPLGINFLVREVLMFLIIRNNRKRSEKNMVARMDKCFLLLWSFTPHPLITPRQLLEENAAIRSELPRIAYYENIKRELDRLVDGYREMGLNVTDDVMPRDLHHLCKCRIRHCMTRAGNLPQGIYNLPIGKKLQEYLLVPEEKNAVIRSELPRVAFYQNIKQELDLPVDGYREMGLNVTDDVMPRDLHHLCKCRIRHCMTRAGNLPQGINNLPISKKLQEYLLVPEESVFGSS
ncbi:hypothetical protein JTE90_018343 [Oedothorax gibbosus]|uniref:SOCS box domain-containing protein n=1 Tax=Oedothorax gibbosus TaxID=931172 RepID=A0AAV6U0K4_9ARAC|nr:hypothetical protein JTE90_018343 [Oedothorax gibbosus]